jgi:hypothetical protein
MDGNKILIEQAKIEGANILGKNIEINLIIVSIESTIKVLHKIL